MIQQKVFVWGLYLILIGLCLHIAYLLWWPMVPFTVTDFKLSTYEAKVGDEVCYQVEGIKHYQVPATITVSLINSRKIILFSFDSNIPMGITHHVKEVCFEVPKVAPGQHRIEWLAIYQPNPFRLIPVKAISKCLTVVK